MGREIRRVPLGWQHPKKDPDNRYFREDSDNFQPLYDRGYNQEAKKWIEGLLLWESGERTTDNPKYTYFWEYEGSPPDKEYYRPDWTEEEMNGYCLYETVSEGTPVSPVFATLDELAEYLAEHGDFWDKRRGNGGWGIERAKAFCNMGWAPSFVGTSDGVFEGKLMANLHKK